MFQVRKNDGRKPLATLVPLGLLESVAHAAMVGLVKYWRDGYRENGGYSLSQCLDSCVRHLFQRTGGHKYDPDGSARLGHPIDHIDMAAWNISAACEALRCYGARNDDLWYGPGSATKDARDNSELRALQKLLDDCVWKMSLPPSHPEHVKEEDRVYFQQYMPVLTEQIETMKKETTK